MPGGLGRKPDSRSQISRLPDIISLCWAVARHPALAFGQGASRVFCHVAKVKEFPKVLDAYHFEAEGFQVQDVQGQTAMARPRLHVGRFPFFDVLFVKGAIDQLIVLFDGQMRHLTMFC